MDKGELKAAILADAHRPDLAGDVDRFIREGEGLIRRELRAAVYSVTLDEDDRVEDGVYALPSTLLEVRVLRIAGQRPPLEQKSLAELHALPANARVLWYGLIGDTIEFRGVPAADVEISLTYFGHPELLAADEDTNALLETHETIYKSAASFFLYKHTQDLELAQGELDTFAAAIERLNEAAGRKLGGASVRPAYHFGPLTRGY